MIDESLLAKVSSLSAADRLELIGVIWETLSPDDLPVTDAERAFLDGLADIETHPDDQSPWARSYGPPRTANPSSYEVRVSTRSVGVNLARRFNAGIVRIKSTSSRQRRMNVFNRRYATRNHPTNLSRP